MALIDTVTFDEYCIETDDLRRLDCPLSDPTSQKPEEGERIIIHAAFYSGLIIAVLGYEGKSSDLYSLVSFFIKVDSLAYLIRKKKSPVCRKTPLALPEEVHPRDITAIAISKDYIIIARGLRISVWSRVEYVNYCKKEDTENTTRVTPPNPKEYDLRQPKDDTDHIIDIIIRDGCIIALTKDGQVCRNQGLGKGGAIDAWSRPLKLGPGANSISMSRDKKTVILVDYPTCIIPAYLAPHGGWELLPARALHPECTYHNNELCDAIALAMTSNNPRAITPNIVFYSPFSDKSTIQVIALDDSFSQTLGQYIAFIFDSYSVTYFGSMGIVKLDYRMHDENKLAAIHSSRYITLNVSHEVEQASVEHEVSGKSLDTGSLNHKRRSSLSYIEPMSKKPRPSD